MRSSFAVMHTHYLYNIPCQKVGPRLNGQCEGYAPWFSVFVPPSVFCECCAQADWASRAFFTGERFMRVLCTGKVARWVWGIPKIFVIASSLCEAQGPGCFYRNPQPSVIARL